MIPALLSSATILYLYWSESRRDRPAPPTAVDDPASRLAALNGRLDAIGRHLSKDG